MHWSHPPGPHRDEGLFSRQWGKNDEKSQSRYYRACSIHCFLKLSYYFFSYNSWKSYGWQLKRDKVLIYKICSSYVQFVDVLRLSIKAFRNHYDSKIFPVIVYCCHIQLTFWITTDNAIYQLKKGKLQWKKNSCVQLLFPYFIRMKTETRNK